SAGSCAAPSPPPWPDRPGKATEGGQNRSIGRCAGRRSAAPCRHWHRGNHRQRTGLHLSAVARPGPDVVAIRILRVDIVVERRFPPSECELRVRLPPGVVTV